MEDEHGQSDEGKFLFKALVGANHFRQRLRRLRLVRDKRVVVHELYNLGIAGEQFILEVKDVGVWGEVANAFENRQGKIGRWNLVCKTLADPTSSLSWLFERIDAGHDATRPVTEPEYR